MSSVSKIHQVKVLLTSNLTYFWTQFQKNKPGTGNEMKFDTSYFLRLIGTSNVDLERSIEEKKAKIVALEQETVAKKDELQNAIEENQEMDEKTLDEQLDYEILTEGCKKFNEQLIELQQQFNMTVDPFNDVRASIVQNKEKHHNLAKLYNEANKKIENHKNQLHQKGKMSQMC
jgi:chromosome segregation ATPase